MRHLVSLGSLVVVVVSVACGGEGAAEGEGEGPNACGLAANTCDLNTLRFCNGVIVDDVDCGADGGFCDAVTLACQGLDEGAACDDRNFFCGDGLACDAGVCTDTGGGCDVDADAVSAVCPGVCLNDCDGAVARHCPDGATTTAVDCDAFAGDAAASCLDDADGSRCLIPFQGTCAAGVVEQPGFVLERCNGSDLVCVLDDDGGACDLADVAADIGADGCSGDVLYVGAGVDRVAVDCGAFGFSCSGGQCVGRNIGDPCTALFGCGADSLCIDGTCLELIGSCDVPDGDFYATCEDVACNLPPEGVCDGTLNHFCVGGVAVDTSDCVAYADDAGATCAVDDVLGVTGCQLPDGAICLRVLPGVGDYFEVCASDDGVGCVEDEDGIGHCLPADDCTPDAQPPQTCDGTLLHAGCLFSGHAYDIDCAVLGADCVERSDVDASCVGVDEGSHCNVDLECDAGLVCLASVCAAADEVCPIDDDAEDRRCPGPCTLPANTPQCAGDQLLACTEDGDFLTINCDSDGTTAPCAPVDGFVNSCRADVGGVCSKYVDALGGTYFGVCAGDAADVACVEDDDGFGHCVDRADAVAGAGCVADVLTVTLLSGHLYNVDCGARGATCQPDGPFCVDAPADAACGTATLCAAGLGCVDGRCQQLE